MHLFVVSDVHSHLDPLKKALDEAGFDPNNEEHWLLSCGDLFDRGPNSEELLYYIMSLERKILIRGNHDLLLEECCKREFPYRHDHSNGTVKTICDIGGAGEGYPFNKCCERTWNRMAAYRDCLVNYWETENYIFVHSWVPTKVTYDKGASKPWHMVGKKHEYMEDWRNANSVEWEEAMWGNPFEFAEHRLNKTGKILVSGHWHASWPRARYEGKPEFGEGADFSPYYGNSFIGIDACCAASGRINVLVIKDILI
jgi:serine/threonine protein phosphatase 1